MTKSIPTYFRYWGKADKDSNNYHLLVYHCMDVAAVVGRLVECKHCHTRHSLCASAGEMAEARVKAWVLFFTALHDYGKFDVRFQLRSQSTLDLLYLVPLTLTL